MKTLFETLNNNKYDDAYDDIKFYLTIDYHKINEYLKNNLCDYINKIDPKFDITLDNNYESNIIDKLSDEGVFIRSNSDYKSDENISKCYINATNNKFKNFKDKIERALSEYINSFLSNVFTLDKKYLSNVNYNDNIVKQNIDRYLHDKLYIDILSKISITFLNKEKSTNDYVLIDMYFSDHYKKWMYTICKYEYFITNKNNKFNIKTGDPVAKEHIIETGKTLSNIENSNFIAYITMYSGYFDDL